MTDQPSPADVSPAAPTASTGDTNMTTITNTRDQLEGAAR